MPTTPINQFDVMLELMHDMGNWLTEQDGAYYRAWGRHLLDDWRSLELVAEKVKELAPEPKDEIIRA